jgi:phage-related protein
VWDQGTLCQAAPRIRRRRDSQIVDDFEGNAYRVVYTVSFARVIYVLHAFQKKSKRGIATPKADLDVIKLRFKRAREDYEKWRENEKTKSK